MSDVLDGPSVALYRLFDRAGALLYVGIASDPRARWVQHKGDKPWWPDVHRYELEWLLSRGSALQKESRVIAEERPLHNILGAGPARRLSDLTGRAPLVPDALLSIRDIMARHQLSRQTLHAYRQRPDFPAPAPNGANSRPRWRAQDVDAYFLANPKRQGARTDLQHRTQP
ncbi:GIY-YIG nuclease family protein [Streptomyces albidoflavus]|nr:GIY-YIG nuclease family protein [Streptomyces albidoflavus]